MATVQPRHEWCVGCFTPVSGRQLAMRNCVLQMISQTRRPDHYSIVVNGDTPASKDTRLWDDLREPWMTVAKIESRATQNEVYAAALRPLLDTPTSLFFKIDSDDVYMRYYIERIIARLDMLGCYHDEPGFCVNLVHQYWVDSPSWDQCDVKHVSFNRGLGLTHEEVMKGMVVGAPPTFVFDRKVAELLLTWSITKYADDRSSDRVWRRLLFDQGIIIKQLRTLSPVFGYVRHDSNICKLSS